MNSAWIALLFTVHPNKGVGMYISPQNMPLPENQPHPAPIDFSELIIALDFDGTCVEHASPQIGNDIGAAPVLRALVRRRARLILWTVRGTDLGLSAALRWFENHRIPLWGVNKNPEQDWSNSPKVYANIYIDDMAMGAPLVYPPNGRPYIDWERVCRWLLQTTTAKILEEENAQNPPDVV